ncbi:iron ABC transporter permease [Blastococcus jejuensis]|uniref:Iron ABC transporter permease n=1 Tax=Blastococcus jejuensis TaxID=351224 RepID=A0ABP6NTC7_9ACTN
MTLTSPPVRAEERAESTDPTADPKRSGRTSPISGKVFIVAGVAAAIGYLALVPLGYLIWGTFFDANNNLDFSGFQRAYGNGRMGELWGNSLAFAGGSAALSLTVGTTLAYLNVRTAVPFKALFFAASIVPLIVPGILYTVSWIFLASPQIGLLNAILEPITGGNPPFNIFSIEGMIWVEGLHSSPIVFLLMVAAFRSMDPSLEESALMSGASRLQTLRRVTLPLVRPALLSAVLVILITSLESFEVPALLGLQDGIYVFTSRIYFVFRSYPRDLQAAGALAVSLLLIAVIGVIVARLLAGKGSKTYQTVTGKGFRPRPLDLGKWKPVVGVGILIYFFATVIGPLLVLLYAALLPYYQAPSWDVFSQFTFDNFREVFEMRSAARALGNSLVLGLGSATIVMALMSVAAWISVRSKIPGRGIVEQLSFVPLVIPGIVLGVSISFVYLRFPFPVYGTLLILLIAYMTKYMPYGMRYASTSMMQISSELEESAQVSGAGWFTTFRRVLLPLLSPGLLAGFIYILVVSFRELSSSLLLYSPGNEVLSILIWEQFENGSFNVLAAIGVLMVLALVVMVTIAYKLGAKVGLRED